MKFALLLLALPTLSFAAITKGTKYQSYNITLEPGSSVSMVLSKSVKTDGCNHYGLHATVDPVITEEGPAGKYVADYAVSHTEMACQPPTKPVVKKLTSDPVVIRYDHETMVPFSVLVPEDVTVKFKTVRGQ